MAVEKRRPGESIENFTRRAMRGSRETIQKYRSNQFYVTGTEKRRQKLKNAVNNTRRQQEKDALT